MRLPVNRAHARNLVLAGLAVTLSACGGSGDSAALSSIPAPATNGPAADYPMVLGPAFDVDGVTYKPEDKLNYDQVGYASIGDGEGISIAHRTLPLPSYAEVTSLETGRTILVRVTRRGPMTGNRLIELSAAAAAQLGLKNPGTPIRIRRVNPPEAERALLRAGAQAPARMDTPMSLVAVLRRKVEPGFALPGAATLPATTPNAAIGPMLPVAKPPALPGAPAKVKPALPATAKKPAVSPPADPVISSSATPMPAKNQPEKAVSGGYFVQVGAFANAKSAGLLASKLGGSASASGKLTRVRVGPFKTRGEADAALAKVRAAGYSDARIQRAD